MRGRLIVKQECRPTIGNRILGYANNLNENLDEYENPHVRELLSSPLEEWQTLPTPMDCLLKKLP